MSRDQHKRVRKLFLRAVRRPADERTALLDAECDDQELRADVQSLLDHHVDDVATDSLDDMLPEVLVPSSGLRSAFQFMARQRPFVTAALTTLLVASVGMLLLAIVMQREMRHVQAASLRTIHRVSLEALEQALNTHRMQVVDCAGMPSVRAVVQDMVALEVGERTDEESADIPKLRALNERMNVLIASWLETLPGATGFGIADERGYVLAIDANDRDWLGRRLSPMGRQLTTAVIAAGPRVLLPFSEDELVDTPLRPDSINTLAFTAPIRGSDGTPVAALAVFVDVEADFTRILSLARSTPAGTTYAFDDRGAMFSAQQIDDAHDSLAYDDKGRLLLLDPGADITQGETPDPVSLRPTTRIVRQALAERSNPEGPRTGEVSDYRDIRGVESFGFWTWLDEFGFGVITEISDRQASTPIRPLRSTSVGLMVATIGALLALFITTGAARMLRSRLAHIRRLGSYTLVEHLGVGGMGDVFLARHDMLKRPTAVKVLSARALTEVGIARFEREVQFMSLLTHPNTVGIYDYGLTTEGLPYFAMEYVDGTTLKSLVETEGALPLARAVGILEQLCGALAEAHTLGLVHRDVKPLNIMLTERGGRHDFVKLLDFGLAKDVQRRQDLTLTSATTGTPLYIAPEVLRSPSATSPRSDVYSVGIIAYYLVTSREVFEGDTALELFAQTLTEDVPTLAALTGISPDFEQLIRDCLAKDPEERPQHAGAVLERLHAIRAAIVPT